MDEFKRTYSNKDTETVAIPHFWEHFNKEDFSVWLAEYQYNEELKRVFMACNLVGGMFQRLEKLHKTAFASVCVFGKDGDVSISGIWICRTQELAFRVGVKHSRCDMFSTTNLFFVLLYIVFFWSKIIHCLKFDIFVLFSVVAFLIHTLSHVCEVKS